MTSSPLAVIQTSIFNQKMMEDYGRGTLLGSKDEPLKDFLFTSPAFFRLMSYHQLVIYVVLLEILSFKNLPSVRF